MPTSSDAGKASGHANAASSRGAAGAQQRKHTDADFAFIANRGAFTKRYAMPSAAAQDFRRGTYRAALSRSRNAAYIVRVLTPASMPRIMILLTF